MDELLEIFMSLFLKTVNYSLKNVEKETKLFV